MSNKEKDIEEIKELIADARKVFPEDLMNRTSDCDFIKGILQAVIEKGRVQLERSADF